MTDRRDTERTKFVYSKVVSSMEVIEVHRWTDAAKVFGDKGYFLVYIGKEYDHSGPRTLKDSLKAGFSPRDGLTEQEARAYLEKISSLDDFITLRTDDERNYLRRKQEGEMMKIISGDKNLDRIYHAIPELVKLASGISPNQTEVKIHNNGLHNDHEKCVVLGWNHSEEKFDDKSPAEAGRYFLIDEHGKFYIHSATGIYRSISEKELISKVKKLPADNFAHASRVADKLEKMVLELGGKI